jgi:Reverse transcriptase (RNA-dependent DNA polymerase)
LVRLSDSFVAYNGVKQGGISSPVLFCIYIDTLLQQLSRTGLGCHIGTQFVGALAYADDNVLVAPTSTAMREMLSICDTFSVNNAVLMP